METVTVHHSQVNCVASRQERACRDDVFCQQHVLLLDRKDLVHDRKERIEGRLDGVAARNGNIAAQNLLKHLRVGHQPLSLGDNPCEQAPSSGFVRMV